MESVPGKFPNSLKSEHLKEGENPIMVSFGVPQDLSIQDKIKKLYTGEEVIGVDNINYIEENLSLLEQKNFKNGGVMTYVISPLDSLDKFSGKFVNCVGIVAVGCDKETHKNISFSSHQNPEEFLKVKSVIGKFETDIRDKLLELKRRSESGAVDIVIVGGWYPPPPDLEKKKEAERYFMLVVTDGDGNHISPPNYQESYVDAIKLISEQVKTVFDFNPVVVGGPKTTARIKTKPYNADTIYYDNEHRRLYLIRDNSNKTFDFHPAFTEQTMDEEKDKWRD
jgi:hypothetical protein